MPTEPESLDKAEETDIGNKTYEELKAMLEDQQDNAGPEAGNEKASGEQHPDQPSDKPEEKQKDDLASKIALLEKRLADQQAFIDRQGQEIGLLRKENAALRKQKEPDNEPDVSDADILGNPKETISKLVEKALAKKAEEAIASKEAAAEARERMARTLKEWVPDVEDHVPAVVEMMTRDQAPKEFIDKFRSDPLGTYPPDVAFHMIKRAIAEKKIAELESKLKSFSEKPSILNRKVDEHARRPVITSTSVRVGKSPRPIEGLTEEDIDKMSYEELQQLQKQL